ncbi:MAG: hypothetical protein WBG36_17250 [Ornithinimicrobium sp.]
MKTSVAAAATVAMLAVAVAGCAGEGTVTEAPVIEGSQESDAEPTAPETEPVEPTAETEPEETVDPAEPDSTFDTTAVGASADSASFGQTVAWDDGISLSISQPETYEPSETAVGSEGFDEAVRFTVTVMNDTDEDFSLLFVITEVTSGGGGGEQIFDYGEGLELFFEDLPAGDEVELDQAFAVEDANDVVITVTPDLFYDEVEFS